MTTTTTPTARELGQARLDAIAQIKSQEDHKRLWKEPANAYPFTWGDCWKQCTSYTVDDYAAEVGFFLDILGLPSHAFGDDFAMFTSPEKEFFFSLSPAKDGETSSPPESVRLMFLISNIQETAETLESRGIAFTKKPEPYMDPKSPMYEGEFKTPHGITIELWGMVQPEATTTDA